ncbi:MBL fold metallo-hydrolase [Paenalkalicoccus suaedae]|uniref:MBL fold metallo-hydrolase n=1 Tax=Paenalkalicoccus suaedae TaxID=2592382 RepID=A0A859FHJ4_9BACI|nr:MBL fold metallo-hydrolase [Paenalkalicoccus suaedae]QKS72551.1 MBL fold metallo-hydrolase [Paenalkalicoccus suaedae]
MNRSRMLPALFLLAPLVMTACGTETPEDMQNANDVNVAPNEEIESEASASENDEVSQENEVEETSNEATHTENEINEANEPVEEEAADSSNEDIQIASATEDLGSLSVHFIDVGQADATLFEFDEATILFDTGDYSRNDVVNYLHANDIEEIDILIGSHPHADHIGQMDTILNEFDVSEVWMSGATATSQTFERVLDAIETTGVDYYEPRAGDIFDVGPLVVEIVHPVSALNDLNDDSISATFTYGDITFLLTGDAEQNAEQMMVNSGYDISADVLQLGHHGSNTSTTEGFLSAVSPSIAIVSAGENNSYGHPHEEVVTRVEQAGIDLYGTHVHGTVIVETDGQEMNVLTSADGTVSPSSSGGSSGGATPADDPDPVEEEPVEEPATDLTPSGCIDINSASFDELQGIIHIGPERAEELISLRPFNSVDDLTRVNGIAAGRLGDIVAEGAACAGGSS